MQKDAFFEEQICTLGLDGAKLQKLYRYADELMLFNSAYDLVGADNYKDILHKHILDSLVALPVLNKFIKDGMQVADVGSGGGLPGIPLAIAYPNVHFTLVERMSKRCNFLENCVLLLGLGNVTIACKEVEKISANTFDLVTFRAFRPLDKIMTKSLLRVTKNGAVLAAYKARAKKIDEEMLGIKEIVSKWEPYPLQTLHLDDGGKEAHERNLVIIYK